MCRSIPLPVNSVKVDLVSSLVTVTSVRDLRQALLPWREAGDTVVLVPTMGALHRGHLSLVQHARKIAKRVVVSIFVNPTQFAAHEDLSRYPRSLEADAELLEQGGCDLLYAPEASAMYPEGFSTSVQPGPLVDVLEGVVRPGHFAGVATVVMKLFLQMLPDAAIFGEKDYQQLLVIRRVVSDLDLPVHVIGLPTIRDDDGLALSSRNAYLSDEERVKAVSLPEILMAAASGIQEGRRPEGVLDAAREQLKKVGFVMDYIALADKETLQPLVPGFAGEARLLAAGRLGTTRLIDNVGLTLGRGS